MFLIKLVTDRYAPSYVSEAVVGYMTSEEEAKEFCEKKSKELTYNKSMGTKYYDYQEVPLLTN